MSLQPYSGPISINFPPASSAMGIQESSLDIDIQKFGIQSVSLISEASWSPRLLVRHFDGREFSYALSKVQTQNIRTNFKEGMTQILHDHIQKYCIKQIRREKLQKICTDEELQKIDIII